MTTRRNSRRPPIRPAVAWSPNMMVVEVLSHSASPEAWRPEHPTWIDVAMRTTWIIRDAMTRTRPPYGKR